nr:glycoside hydrolase family 16 protein [Actinomadura macra]
MPVSWVVLGSWGWRVAVIAGCLLVAGAILPDGGGSVPPSGMGGPRTGGTGADLSGKGPRDWGRPVASDDFDGTAIDRAAWDVYDGTGHDGAGRRSPAAVSVRDGVLTITGRRGGTTGGVAWMRGAQRHGRWEARIRMSRGCACYHPVLLLWPIHGGGGVSPAGGGGEIDYTETIDDGRRRHTAFYLHYGPEHDERRLDARLALDMTRWHVFAVEWTPRGITGYADGRRWFHTADPVALPPGPMGQTIQLDWFPKDRYKTARNIDSTAPVTLQADWIRMYRL